MSSTTGQPRNRRYLRVSQQRKTKLRWPEKCLEHQNVHKRRSSSRSASIYIRVHTSEADFNKPEIYRGRVRVWATEWDVFDCTPSRGGRGRRATVDIFHGVFFQCLVVFRVFFRFLYFERTRPTASTRQPCLMYLSTSKIIRAKRVSNCYIQEKKTDRLSVCTHNLLVLVWKNCHGSSVGYQRAPGWF